MFPVDDVNNLAYIIFSTSLPEEEVRKGLTERKLPFKVLEGKYKGVKETSYIIKFQLGVSVTELMPEQESVLVLSPVQDNGLRKALLHYKDRDIGTNGIVPIGDFTPVSQEIAEAQDNYTYDPTQNQYFVAM